MCVPLSVQVANLYNRLCAAAGRKAGAWSPEEDRLLLSAVQTHGRKFAMIEQLKLVPGRTQRQMKDRYRGVLNPEMDHGPVTEQVMDGQIVLVCVLSFLFESFCFVCLHSCSDCFVDLLLLICPAFHLCTCLLPKFDIDRGPVTEAVNHGCVMISYVFACRFGKFFCLSC